MIETLEQKIKRVDKDPVDIVPYNPDYPKLFEELRQELITLAPKGFWKRIEHFGSTAIPNIAAKPVIDVLIEVDSLQVAQDILPPIFEPLGHDYFWRPTTGNDGKPWYCWVIMRHTDKTRRAHIHIVTKNFPHWDRLKFRDYLCQNKYIAHTYEALKYLCATQFPNDREAYTNAKSNFIQKITLMATHKIIETPRLCLRKMVQEDYTDSAEILQNPDVMYAYEHAFCDQEVEDWLNRQFERYKKYGFGLWGIIDKETTDFIGQCGLAPQDVDGVIELEIGYLLKHKYWHNGYATEAAKACLEYAQNTLKQKRVVCTIRDNNFASQHVAERLGMHIEKTFIKHYHTIDMPHYLYVIE